jgi:hypothetical protein
MSEPTQYELDKALADKLARRTVKTTGGGLVTILWHAHGSESSYKRAGTLWRAIINKGPRREFAIFTPAPKNNRGTGKALLVRHLRKETLGLSGAVVEEIAQGETLARSKA